NPVFEGSARVSGRDVYAPAAWFVRPFRCSTRRRAESSRRVCPGDEPRPRWPPIREPGQKTAEELLKKRSLPLHCGLSGLRQQLADKLVSLQRAAAVILFRAFFRARTSAEPRSEIIGGGKRFGVDSDFG